ncbi:hypothetical protein BD289DRAFT_436527 [Coniella lustricola]|uniref:Uncharacterized protein n=1 Tax=Coniella lustricola TaxID=2025994 RepID=A0A2T3A509_9PEZI|nr:hypothetical protein BD289DRAFT_436527 [Coniella lustricola]
MSQTHTFKQVDSTPDVTSLFSLFFLLFLPPFSFPCYAFFCNCLTRKSTTHTHGSPILYDYFEYNNATIPKSWTWKLHQPGNQMWRSTSKQAIKHSRRGHGIVSAFPKRFIECAHKLCMHKRAIKHAHPRTRLVNPVRPFHRRKQIYLRYQVSIRDAEGTSCRR